MDSISCLGQEVTEVSIYMLSIMNMAGVEQVGYELQKKQTVFRATKCFKKLLDSHKINSKAFLFINSIANICITKEEEQRYHKLYADLQQRVVIEITETENLDMEQVKHKQSVEGFSGMFALDDYGIGYNSEINLLELKSTFVKIDISIVRNVNQDVNKRRIISNLVNYEHQWDIFWQDRVRFHPQSVKKQLKLFWEFNFESFGVVLYDF